MNDRGGGRRSSDAGEAKGGEPTDETAALRVGIGDGANTRKEDMVKLAESKKVAGTTFRVNHDASSTSMARKHKVGGFRGTKKVKDPSRLKRVNASAKQRAAFLELKAMADEANERGEPCPDQLVNLEEKLPRERKTKTDTERSLIDAAHHEVITKVPPVPRLAYKSWKAIEEAVADYEKATNTHYRVRSSGSVREYNETYSDQLPMGLEFSFKTFCCVNSVYQESRAKGDRSNNTGGDIPVDGEVARTASLLADAKASTKDIGVLLSRQLGRKFTPQQTKNLLKRIVTTSRVKTDSRCFLTHSHRWKTLAMDWAHLTSNLVFHLGSLVATGPSGRGIPVLDFMAVNEKAKTLKVIFEYFKSNNPGWQQVRSFVIDKHFVEWRMLGSKR
ncbi:hypothetical protein PC116_g7112 [Phytophthora cactorum]|uniref:ZSWIM1/3 RNaseH-like domain-containing protein n=1 Tax=Phytophthora cactorum TaxID=29920 RepID=A0A8T1DD35_9STRA|nr:hypothetical protein PC115_g3104 [Phytophthora cactorum]KAG4245084.1 hypothetical protein PC116_g7112 [Phytophthora cactorum]